jgi:hypothetical protein
MLVSVGLALGRSGLVLADRDLSQNPRHRKHLYQMCHLVSKSHHSPIWLAWAVRSLHPWMSGVRIPQSHKIFELAVIEKIWGTMWHPLIGPHVAL